MSPTQRLLDPDQVRRYVTASLGPTARVTDCGPLSGGGFAAVWWVTLDDWRHLVLKVGPAPDVPLLRYRDAGQGFAVQGGGEGPRGRAG